MNLQPTLFEPPPESEVERAHRIDVQILDTLCGKCAYPISERQRSLLHLLRSRRGLDSAISIGEIGERLKINPRTVKEEISDLTIRFRIPIGSSRDAVNSGYYLAITRQECVDSATPHIRQALVHLQRARVLLDEKDLLELVGQLNLHMPEVA